MFIIRCESQKTLGILYRFTVFITIFVIRDKFLMKCDWKKNATCWAKTWNVKNGEYQVNDTKKLSSNVQYLHFHVPFQIIQSLVRADVLRIIIANAKNMKIIAVNRSPWFSCFKPSSNLEFTVLTWFDFYLQLQSYQFQNVTPKMMLRSASQAL